MLARVGTWLDRAAFRPGSLPDDLITGIALCPPVIAGLVIFRIAALEMLGVAVGAGIAGVLVLYWLSRHRGQWPGASPIISAVFAVALVGPGGGSILTAEIAVLAVVLEGLRIRYMPAVCAQAGLIAFGAIALATRGGPFKYVDPSTGKAFGDPIKTWYQFFSSAAAPIDPVRLYVGNVPGPVFATSLLAVAIGVAWLAYARRVSLAVLASFLLGGYLAINTFHWDPIFQLDSGPTWFVAGLLLADRRLLPDSWAVRPALGFAGGLFAIGLRHEGYGVEAAFIVVATVQAVMAVVVVVLWSLSITFERWRRKRRLRQRKANLRLVKPASRPS